MKNRGFLFCLLLILLGNTACTKYYYSFIQSDRPDARKNELGDFVQENDSVCIIYSFHGENLPVNITVINKSDKLLYVDWNQSALIVDDVTSYYAQQGKKKKKDAPTIRYSYTGGDKKFIRDRYSGFAQKLYSEEGVSFLPPDSRINHIPLVLTNFTFFKLPDEIFTKTSFQTSDTREKKVNSVSFTEQNSPVRFRSYLTLFSVDDRGRRTGSMHFDQSFYISSIIKAGKQTPENFRQFQQQRGDFFFVRDERAKNAGVFAGLIAVGVTGIAIEIAAGPYEY